MLVSFSIPGCIFYDLFGKQPVYRLGLTPRTVPMHTDTHVYFKTGLHKWTPKQLYMVMIFDTS